MNDLEKAEYLQNAIDEVMDWFDFDRVHQTMTFLKWNWGTEGVPTIQDLRKFVRENMKRTYYTLVDNNKDYDGIATGGFCIECVRDKEDGVIYFKVRFELTSWHTGE